MDSRPNPLLAASAVLYLVVAIPLLFAPEETAGALGAAPAEGQVALLQVIGSALLGFAMLNWSSRYSRLGGVYGRPLVLANLAHAATAFLLLAKPALRAPSDLAVLVPTMAYLGLAIGFGSRLFVAPARHGGPE